MLGLAGESEKTYVVEGTYFPRSRPQMKHGQTTYTGIRQKPIKKNGSEETFRHISTLLASLGYPILAYISNNQNSNPTTLLLVPITD